MTYEIEEISNTDMFLRLTENIYRTKDGYLYLRQGNLFRPYILYSSSLKAYQLVTKEEKVLKILREWKDLK